MERGRGTKGEQNRERIVAAAERLFYERGYASTSFAHVAEASGIPKGNFYFYFQDKRSIFAAVVERRIAALRSLCESLAAAHDNPLGRLCGFVDHLVARRDEVADYGCPVGSLTGEVGKWRDEHLEIATRLFDVLLPFLQAQFRALGAKPKAAEQLALELLCRTQGINTLAQAYKSPTLVRVQGERVKRWLRTLELG